MIPESEKWKLSKRRNRQPEKREKQKKRENEEPMQEKPKRHMHARHENPSSWYQEDELMMEEPHPKPTGKIVTLKKRPQKAACSGDAPTRAAHQEMISTKPGRERKTQEARNKREDMEARK